jgi:hypothetical protein
MSDITSEPLGGLFMSKKRSELQNEVVEALIKSKAVNLEAVGSVIAKYGDRAARLGDSLGIIVHWRSWDICIPPEPYLDTAALERAARDAARKG